MFLLLIEAKKCKQNKQTKRFKSKTKRNKRMFHFAANLSKKNLKEKKRNMTKQNKSS